jgi:hypothetical protein
MIFGMWVLPLEAAALAAAAATLEWDQLPMHFPRILRHMVSLPRRARIKRTRSKRCMAMVGAWLVQAAAQSASRIFQISSTLAAAIEVTSDATAIDLF